MQAFCAYFRGVKVGEKEHARGRWWDRGEEDIVQRAGSASFLREVNCTRSSIRMFILLGTFADAKIGLILVDRGRNATPPALFGS